jgi:cytochrome c oxidase assembly protein subunit 15
LSVAARLQSEEASSSSRDKPEDPPVPRAIGYWLLAIGGMVYVMVALGGVTRLTESGLSMVDWKLLGRKLPSSDDEWNEEFDKYKQFPEYQLKHYNISLEEYKFIYFMEWFHRMWGRAIGVAFAVPFMVFGVRGMVSRSMFKKLAVAMGMGGCQGLVGWYMVKSGLEKPKEEGQEVHVSPYRLCMHLTSAFIIYSYVMWLAMSVLRPRPSALASSPARGIKKLAHAAAGVLGITIVSGKATLSSVMLVVHLESTSNSVPHAWSRCFCCRQPRWRVLPRVALDGRLLHTAAHVGYCPRLAQHL